MKKANIETVEDAMNIAELEYKKRKNVTAKSTKVTKVEKPVWFNKETIDLSIVFSLL